MSTRTPAATTHATSRSIAHIRYAKPEWSDAQRTAWQAATAIYAAKSALYDAFYARIIPSIEPAHRAWLAWSELEREIEIIGLFPEEK